MNRSSNTLSFSRLGGVVALAATASAAALLASGCGGKDVFAKVNGQAITQSEYIRALERQQVALPGGQSTSAERFVLDKLIGDKIILAEAAKMNVLPQEEEINRVYDVQKRLWEQQMPGKDYEKTMREQGGSPEDTKADLRVALAETALFAKRLNLQEEEVKKAYSGAKGQFGLPERVQIRLIVTPANSPAFSQTQKMLAEKKSFEEVARQTNPPQLRGNGGLIAQATPMQQIPPAWQSKVRQTADGNHFGPVDFNAGPNQPTAKAWVKVEKKLPAVTIPYEDARQIVRRQLVQVKMMQPDNRNVREQLMKQKMDAKFDATTDSYEQVWAAYKDAAKAAGVAGQQPAAAPAAGGMGVPAPGPGTGAPVPIPVPGG